MLREPRPTRALWMVPGGGVEPPRPEGRRILSPLRLPVPPSRHFVEVLDSTAYFTFYVFFIQDSDCETVQVNVEVFADFHKSSSPFTSVKVAAQIACQLRSVVRVDLRVILSTRHRHIRKAVKQ